MTFLLLLIYATYTQEMVSLNIVFFSCTMISHSLSKTIKTIFTITDCLSIQWNLRIKDTLRCVHCREVILFLDALLKWESKCSLWRGCPLQRGSFIGVSNVCRWMILPMQSLSFGARIVPGLQAQVNDPSLLLHISSQPPLSVLHSFTSLCSKSYNNISYLSALSV